MVKEQIAPLIEQAGKEMNLPVIDCYTPLEGKKDMIPDGVHPNAEGYAVIAKTIGDAIQAAKAADAKAPAP